MILLCVTLLLLHHGYSQTPVISVHPGEPAVFTCVLPANEISVTEIHWYKQTIGKTLTLIVKLKKNIEPTYGPEFPESRVFVFVDNIVSNLTILRATPEDEGLYHCAVLDYITNMWSGTYLSLTRKKVSDYTVVQWATVSDPLRPGDSMSLRCSVLSDSDSKTCPGAHSVYWVRVGPHYTDPGVIYTDGNRPDGCNNDTQSSPKSCLYHFSKTISSSDAGTYYYYCAVATCGRILFGNGTRIQTETSVWSQDNITLVLLCTILGLCLSVITVYICSIVKGNCSGAVTPDKINHGQKSHQRCENTGVYSVAVFTVVENGCDGRRNGQRRRIYAAAKASGLN